MSLQIRRLPIKHFAVYLFYFCISLFVTWPLITQMSTHLYGGFLTDAFQSARHTWWIKYALQNGQPLFEQPLFAYPDGLHGAWIWANPFEYFPGWLLAFVMPLNTAANLTVLIHMTLNGWAAYFLIDHLTDRKHWPALIGGLVFMAYPAIQSRVYGGHVGVLALWPAPLYLYALFMLKDSSQKRWYVMAALFCVLSIAGNSTLLVYYLLPISGIFLLARLFARDWLWLKRSLIATIMGGLLTLIFLMPLAIETNSTPQYNPDIGGSTTYSADLLSIVSPSFFHPLFKNLHHNGYVLSENILEGTGYIGIITTLLIVLALWQRKEARWWLELALVAWICSLGPLLHYYGELARVQVGAYETYIVMPWALIQKLPVFDISRTPGRFNLTIGLAVSVMVGYGTAYLWQWSNRFRWRIVLIPMLMVVILYDYRIFWPLEGVDDNTTWITTEAATVPTAVSDLAERDDIRAVFNVPWNDRIHAKHGLYLQAYHQQNILAGQFIRDTPVNPAKLSILQETLDPALLDAAGVDIVIFHKGGPVGYYLPPLLEAQLGTPAYSDDTIAIYEVPDADTSPEFTSLASSQAQITDSGDSYFYAPQPGWVQFSGVFEANSRLVELYLDGERVHDWIIDGETQFHLALPVTEAGFHTARLSMIPACPQTENATLVCDGVRVIDLELDDFTVSDFDSTVSMDMGISLNAAFVPSKAQAGTVITALLWWDFDEPLKVDASRFVHILDADGNSVAQADAPIAATAEKTSWLEAPQIMLADNLPPGTYNVYTGWYTFPSQERIAVLSDAAEAVNGWIFIGAIEIVSQE